MCYRERLATRRPVRFRNSRKHTLHISFAHTQNTHTFLVTALSHATLYVRLTAQKNAIPFGMALSLWLTISIIFHRQLLAPYMRFLRV